MKRNTRRRYTLRNIPDEVDQVLRQRARSSGKSFNQIAVEALAAGIGMKLPRRDLSRIVGTLSPEEASALDHEIALQRHIDLKLWVETPRRP